MGRLEGPALVGAQIWIDRAGEQSVIRVASVGAITFPVGAPDPVETYILEYAMAVQGVPNGPWTNICEGLPISTGDPDLDVLEALVIQPQASIMFEGDRIDLATKTVNATPDPDWFNIGCPGHTLAKLHLTRNTIASTGVQNAAQSFAARQATLKMLTADYCGTGVPFTVAGQRLVWRGGDVDYVKPPRKLEARWDEHGAVCLWNPRMGAPTTAEGAIRFPDIEAAIAAECPRPPYCTDLNQWELHGALRISSNR
jgi:hypothetical protein